MMTPYIWKKSTRSGPWTDNCVEVQWRKSSLSLTDSSCVEVGVWQTSTRSALGAECVEVAGDPDGVLVRDTKDRDGGALQFSEDSWRAFLAGIKDGDFDMGGA